MSHYETGWSWKRTIKYLSNFIHKTVGHDCLVRGLFIDRQILLLLLSSSSSSSSSSSLLGLNKCCVKGFEMTMDRT